MIESKKKVYIVGTNGIPAQYGGFETLAEYLTKYLSDEFDFTVYCSNTQPKLHNKYNGSKLKYIRLKANGWQSIFYDIYSLFHAAFRADVILYLGPGAGFIVPIIKVFKKNIIVNHGGLNEWEREKYNCFQRFVAKLGHKYAAKYATFNIADGNLLKDSIFREFKANCDVIRYGGDHAIKVEINDELVSKYPFLNTNYFVNVSRAQIDNNLHLVLEAFKDVPERNLVMVSNWSVSKYGIELKSEYMDKFKNISILDAIYDSKEINSIRGNAIAYIHSHSYCGTSPSLVEAMSLGLPIFSFDIPTNRETTEEKAFFFKNSNDLASLITSKSKEDLNINGGEMKKIADNEYTWPAISSKYAIMFRH
jgi:glycosyltransferase involved in cell wall biosynthesis